MGLGQWSPFCRAGVRPGASIPAPPPRITGQNNSKKKNKQLYSPTSSKCHLRRAASPGRPKGQGQQGKRKGEDSTGTHA